MLVEVRRDTGRASFLRLDSHLVRSFYLNQYFIDFIKSITALTYPLQIFLLTYSGDVTMVIMTLWFVRLFSSLSYTDRMLPSTCAQTAVFKQVVCFCDRKKSQNSTKTHCSLFHQTNLHSHRQGHRAKSPGYIVLSSDTGNRCQGTLHNHIDTVAVYSSTRPHIKLSLEIL